MIEYIKDIFTSSTAKDLYTIIVTFIALFFVFRSMYNKIKYVCLEKATEKIASVEELEELSGEEKFALVLSWINTDLPKIFNNAAMQNILENIVDFAYNSAFKYAKNYIKRKTGYDLSELINRAKELDEVTKNESSTETNKK